MLLANPGMIILVPYIIETLENKKEIKDRILYDITDDESTFLSLCYNPYKMQLSIHMKTIQNSIYRCGKTLFNPLL